MRAETKVQRLALTAAMLSAFAFAVPTEAEDKQKWSVIDERELKKLFEMSDSVVVARLESETSTLTKGVHRLCDVHVIKKGVLSSETVDGCIVVTREHPSTVSTAVFSKHTLQVVFLTDRRAHYRTTYGRKGLFYISKEAPHCLVDFIMAPIKSPNSPMCMTLDELEEFWMKSEGEK